MRVGLFLGRYPNDYMSFHYGSIKETNPMGFCHIWCEEEYIWVLSLRFVILLSVPISTNPTRLCKFLTNERPGN